MIRKTLLAIAAVATIAGAATSANAGYYGYGYKAHVPVYKHVYTHKPVYFTKCFKKFVGYKRVWGYYGHLIKKPIFKRVCKRIYY